MSGFYIFKNGPHVSAYPLNRTAESCIDIAFGHYCGIVRIRIDDTNRADARQKRATFSRYCAVLINKREKAVMNVLYGSQFFLLGSHGLHGYR